MKGEPTFLHWVELPDSRLVKFRALPGLIARALHSEPVARAKAEINVEKELWGMVDAGALRVHDPLTLDELPFPIGETMRRAVLYATELRPVLQARGIGLKLIPFGNGPTYWTIENAAAAIAAQEEWHAGARDTLRRQMMQAVREGLLRVRHPHTDLWYQPKAVRDWYELVTPTDVNDWLALDPGSTLRWHVATASPAELPTAVAVARPTDADKKPEPWWRTEHDILDMAQNVYDRLKSNNDPRRRPSAKNVATDIANRIRDIERRKMKDRPTPGWERVRKVLRELNFKPRPG